MRIIVILLLSLLLFFGGVAYGAKGQSIPEESDVETIEETYPVIEVEEKIERKEETDEYPPIEDPVVNRTASLLEKIVSTFYEVCIEVMYAFVNLFFD